MRERSGGHQRAVIVAMVAMRMMQVAVDEVADVIAVRHGFMPAVRAMLVILCVSGTGMLRRAAVRVRGRNLDHVLIDVAVVHMVQVAVMQIVDMARVLDGRMTAAGTVDVGVIGVLRIATGHQGLQMRGR